MDFGSFPPAGFAPVATVLCLLVGAAALLSAPWRALLASNQRQHVFLACALALPLLWMMRFEVPGGAHLHLLGMTTLTLMFGWQLALVLGAAAGAVLVIVDAWSLGSLAPNLVLCALLPVAVTLVMLGAANRLSRTNLFVYLLGVAFAGGSAALLAPMLLGGWLQGPGFDHAVTLLLVFPEGFLNGTLVTALAVFHPRILRTFDDERYLDGQ